MNRFVKRCGIKLIALFLIMGLGVLPVEATVPGDIAAGLPLEKVLANGLGAGLSIEAVITQALDAGAEWCPLVKAAIAQRLDLSRVFKAILDREPHLCTVCDLMKCSVAAGSDMVEAANALMVAGAKLEAVRECLAGLGYSQTYGYSGPAAPGDPGGGPNFPGGGGGGVASPSS